MCAAVKCIGISARSRLVASGDGSGAVRVWKELELVKMATEFMVDHLGEGDKVGVFQFDSQVSLLNPKP